MTSHHTLETYGVLIQPLSIAEIDWLRTYGRQEQTFEALAQQAIRFRLLSVAGCIPDDVDARRGAERAEVAALLGIALRPAASVGEIGLQESLFAAISEGRDDNLPAMLTASLAADAARFTKRAKGRAAGDFGWREIYR